MDKKKYDFSDFDEPKLESKSYDFSDFDIKSSQDAEVKPQSKSYGDLVKEAVDSNWLVQATNPEAVGTFLKEQREGIPVVGPAAAKAGRGFRAFLASMTPDGALPDSLKGKTMGELFDQFEKQDAEQAEKDREKSPVASTLGSLSGAAMIPTPGTSLKGIAGAGARIAGNTAITTADAGLRGQDMGDAALISGGISAGLEAIPMVGQGAKAVKKFIPGTDDALPAVNKGVAKIASLIPGSAEAEAIEDLYSNPALRRKAATTNLDDEATRLLPNLNKADEALDHAVGKRFAQLEDQSIRSGTRHASSDLNAYEDMLMKLSDVKDAVEVNSPIYGSKVSKLINDVDLILSGGGPKETKLSTFKKSIGDIASEMSPGSAATSAKFRSLNARRHLDDFMKNKDFEKLSMYEKQAITDIRKSLDDTLKNVYSGSAERKAADEMFSGYKKSRDDLFEPLKYRGPSGAELDAGKLGESLKTGRAKGDRFERSIKGMQDYLEKAEPQLGKIPEVESLAKELASLRELSDMGRISESVKRGGGPTSQAVNMLTQVTIGGPLAGVTGGLSIPVQMALLPVTNPAAWVKVVDGLNKAGHGKLAQSIKNASKAVAKANPGIVSRFVLLNRDE